MANNLLEQARQAVNRVVEMGQNMNQADHQKEIEVAKNVIHSAYAQSSAEEQAELQELEQQIENHLQ
ncbi:DUF3813 domain-containing protein [Salirhabdus salicampi]|uniref:DUF3813 domain-containing protein n=1 Tax=Salirhabdus salicampi TaxID=476102 RepID=UPI0020C20D59|nr:DUF3813 domain-containing protein [Salirhabdus salicampi]MCP8615557.1 DUF3813 domain-containing protein [Salirhabdus salicampi]